MAGVKISNATQFAAAQLADKLAAARGATPGAISVEQIIDLMSTQGFLIGDPSAIYAENQSDGQKWQIGQKSIVLTLDGDNVTPNCEQNDMFYFYPSGGTREIQPPINVNYSNLGGQYNPFRFTIYVRFMNTSPEVTFHSNYSPIPGSKPWDKSGQINVVECWYHPLGGYYRINNSATDPNEVLRAEGIITSAQILDSNTNPVELIPSPGSGMVIAIDSISCMSGDGDSYETNTNGYIRYADQSSFTGLTIDLTTPLVSQMPAITSPYATLINKAVIFGTDAGDPTAGTFDIWYDITYRVINDPFA